MYDSLFIMGSPLKENSPRDKNSDDGHYFHPSSPRDEDSAPSLKAFLLKVPRDKEIPDSLVTQTIEGNIASNLSKDSSQINPNLSSTKGTLPSHLNYNPPTLIIPDGYKWIFVHGGWTLIPIINTINFMLKILHLRRIH